MDRDALILDRYEPIGTAGEGGFGTVQIAWDPRIQRKVAIKTIKLTEQDAYRAHLPGAQAVSADQTRERWHGAVDWNDYLAQSSEAGGEAFRDEVSEQVHSLAHLPGLDEARTAAMLSDPRIVTVFDFEVRGRTAYLIMEYVEGLTLTSILRDYADYVTLDVVAAVFDAVAGALVAAHEAGVLHLDIKPDNILVNAKGEVKVTDFGLATLADASGAGTTGGGTIGYMPPEQIRRENLDARADEWSLASVTYEMLSGENPFRVEKLSAALGAIEDAELVLPSLCWEGMDEQIDDVIFYALDPDRDGRYATVADFAEEAEKFLGRPDAGSDQLSAIVSDALGLLDSEDFDEDDAGSTVGVAWGFRGADGERLAVRDALSERVLALLGRACGALGSAFVAALAAWNLPLLASVGLKAPMAMGLAALLFGVAGALAPSIGALASLALLAVALVAQGAILPGLVLIAATVAWWAIAGHEGVASANVVLTAPLLGSVGGASAAPLFAGASLRPLPALVTAVEVTVCAAVLGSLGTGSLLGWDAFANWGFVRTDVMAGFVRLVTTPATWCTAAGWWAAAFVQALLSTRGRRWLEFAGVAAGAVIIVVASLALSAPSPQLFVSVILGALAVVAAIL